MMMESVIEGTTPVLHIVGSFQKPLTGFFQTTAPVGASTLNGLLVPLAGPLAEATRVYPLQMASKVSKTRLPNTATPADAIAWGEVPAGVLHGLEPKPSVTTPLKPGAVFPAASRAVTSTAGDRRSVV